MAQVFLSYDREDGAKARTIAQALERAGHSVWWDRHIKGGAQYSKEIEVALKRADAVVVLWSEQSVDSAWVRDEAAAGRDSGRLVPVLIDSTEPPLGFRQYQAIDLSRWKGRGKAPGLTSLEEAIAALVGQTSPPHAAKTPRAQTLGAFPLRLAAFAIGLLLVAATAAFLLLGGSNASRIQTVVVAPADRSLQARALARDLLVDLGHLQTAKNDRLRLVGQSDKGVKSDLIFEAAAARGPAGIGANLVLLAGNDRSLLWSRDFQQESGNHADLRQQVAFTAARILGCASEGLGTQGQRLDPPTLKSYLNVCAQLAEIDGNDTRSVIPALTKIVEKSPWFEAAWAQLLLADAEASKSAVSGRIAEHDAIRLRARIADLRRINPVSPAVAIAEASLVPPRDFAKRLALLDRAIGEAPDNVQLLAGRSRALGSVGRLREAIEDATRAADLDPLSPVMRDGHISALLYGGLSDVALQELRKAEQLWPGTESVEQMQYRYHLRFGDPLTARRLLQGRAQGYVDLFLTARADPSRENVDRMIDYMWGRVRSGEEAPTNVSGLSIMMQALGQFGRTDELYGLFNGWKSDEDLSVVSDLYFRPALRSFIRDPRFMGIARRAGLIDYWRMSGKWPDFCFEPGLPYDCKAEAAKLSPS